MVPRKNNQKPYIEHRLHPHGFAASRGEGLGRVQRQRLGCRIDCHESNPCCRGCRSRRHRLRCRRLSASVAATLSGLPSRAIWFSSDRITYWLQSAPPYKTLQDLKGKKIALSGGVGGTNHVALMIALEKSNTNPKDYVIVGIPGQQAQVFYSLDSSFVEAALLSPPHMFIAARKGFNKLLDVGAMVEMPGGGLTTLIKTIQSRPAEMKRVIHALQLAKDEVRKSKPKTVELIMRLLKMDKQAASETYDTFQTTLNPTGIPNRAGIDNLVRSLQAQGRFTDRKVAFSEVADDRLATEVAKELGYRFH